MIDNDYGLDATIQLSEDKNENGEQLVLIVFKPKSDIEEEKDFENKSYLNIGKKENVVISHVVNFDTDKTLYKENGKKTYVIIFNTHMYVEPQDVDDCFEVYARAMKNSDNWMEIPGHDISKLKLTA